MEPNLKSWELKPFFSCFILSKAWTTMVIINTNFSMTSSSFPIKLWLSVGNHFKKLLVENVLHVKEPFNHVNSKIIFCSRRNFNIVRFYRKVQGNYTFDSFVGLFCKMVLVCQLRIFRTLYNDRRNFSKFLQCRPWVFCRGVFYYHTM